MSVASSADPARVLEILAKIVGSHPHVLKTTEPLITFEQFGEWTLKFSVRFWTRAAYLLGVRSDLNLLMADELAKNGILAPSPPRGVHFQVAEATAEAAGRSAAKSNAVSSGVGGPP